MGAASSKSSRPTQSTAVPRWPTGSCQHAFYFSTLRERGQFDLICYVVCITGPLQHLCLYTGPDTGLDWRVPHPPPVPSAPQPTPPPAGHHSHELWMFTVELPSNRLIQLFPDCPVLH